MSTDDSWEPSIMDLLLNGVVVDEYRAKATPCMCMETPNGKLMCWSEGIVGVLSQEQIKKYCPKIVKKNKPHLLSRLLRFREASKLCRPLTIQDRLKCIALAITRGLDVARDFLETHTLLPGRIPVSAPSTQQPSPKTVEEAMKEVPEEYWEKHGKV